MFGTNPAGMYEKALKLHAIGMRVAAIILGGILLSLYHRLRDILKMRL